MIFLGIITMTHALKEVMRRIISFFRFNFLISFFIV